MIKERVIDKLTTLVSSAFGLVAALAWNNAVKALIDEWFTIGNGIVAMFIYALTITIIAISVIVILEKISEEIKEFKIAQMKEAVIRWKE